MKNKYKPPKLYFGVIGDLHDHIFFYRFTGDLNNGETSIGSSSTTSPEPVNFDDKRTNDEFKNEALEEKSDDTEDNISENIKYIPPNIFFKEKVY